MKISKSHNNTKKISILAVLIVFLATTGTFLVWSSTQKTRDNEQSSSSTPTEAQQKESATSNANEKQQFLDNEAKQKDSTGETPQPSKPPTNQDVDLAARTEGENVIITSKITTLQSGTCTLRITGGPTPFSQQAAIIYNPEFSTCAGFSINKQSISASTWTITLEVSNGSVQLEKTIKFTP